MDIDFVTLSSLINNLLKLLPKTEGLKLKEYILRMEEAYSNCQKDNIRLNKEIMNLAEQIKQYDNWEQEKQNYELHKLASNALVYRKKESHEFVCPSCYQVKKVIVHLQPPVERDARFFKWCPNCNSIIKIIDI